MKLTNRGFTLVELMIVIAIIGILAAALFPSLTSYLKRGRDTARASGVKEISTAIAAYQVDKQSVPGAYLTTCAHSGNLSAYIQKFPVDPSNITACAIAGTYGYGTGTANATTTAAVSAFFENPNGGNTGTISVYQGNTVNILSIDSFTKGFGSGYVVRN